MVKPPRTRGGEDDDHPFIQAPHKTLFVLSIPVLFSLVAEPLTGLVDTAYVAKLGSDSLAALGIGTTLLSSLFWIFNFLGIGSQTEVANALGSKDTDKVRQIASLVVALGLSIGCLLVILLYVFCVPLVIFMGAEGEVLDLSTNYTYVRLFGAPAILISFGAFGIMRGMQDMKTPLWIAAGINILNILLDPLLIFGLWSFPAMGVTGAALASIISQWLGAFICLWYLLKKTGGFGKLQLGQALRLFKVGRDLFLRTGALLLFLLLTTRAATNVGAVAGAAHQAIRQGWIFSAFFMDAFAVTGQSLVAYFIGAGLIKQARKVARVVCGWSLVSGVILALVMIVCEEIAIMLLVPAGAVTIFSNPWLLVACSQPINSLAFATDGIHWGTADFVYLRNVVILATFICSLILFYLECRGQLSLMRIWIVIVFWLSLRAFGGVIRIWPGIGNRVLSSEEQKGK